MADTISTGELKDKIGKEDSFVLIDVLGKEHFEKGHIPGAVNIPLEELGSIALQELERDDDIVVYCKSQNCQASPKAAKKLEKLRFENITDYEPGLKGWKDAGNEVEIS